ncbi:hypothetical protein Fot_43143 [Forsythia ovata]|uniref:Uncharacterized protein n=1 Tax=Forsythia ovata TaxID=205694 RepID=A0ABD1RNN8_9LAMI
MLALHVSSDDCLGLVNPIPLRPPSPDNSNVRKGLVIIDSKIGEELPRLDPSKLQCKAKREKRKSKQEEYQMSSRNKRHKSSSNVKLVEIVELSSSESDVLDDKMEVVEEVEGDAIGSECDKVKGVGRGESRCEIGHEGDNAGNDNDIVGNKSGNVGIKNKRENNGVDGQLENDGNANEAKLQPRRSKKLASNQFHEPQQSEFQFMPTPGIIEQHNKGLDTAVPGMICIRTSLLTT